MGRKANVVTIVEKQKNGKKILFVVDEGFLVEVVFFVRLVNYRQFQCV